MKRKIGIVAASVFILAMSCKKDDIAPVDCPPAQNEEELITTMKLVFVDSAGIEPNKEFVFRDVDGVGGNAPTEFDTIRILNNTTYNVSVELLNESVSPADDISAEVLAEADEHLFCYLPSGLGSNLSIIRTDSDGTYEIGLATKWTTTATSSGFTEIKLKHQPGVKNGLCDPGETDIELNFVVEIQ